jgi:hypothetical protein
MALRQLSGILVAIKTSYGLQSWVEHLMGSERDTLPGNFGTKKWVEPVLEILDLRRVSYWENALRGSKEF